MKGWRYEWAGELPREVYAVIVEEMNKAAQSESLDDFDT